MPVDEESSLLEDEKDNADQQQPEHRSWAMAMMLIIFSILMMAGGIPTVSKSNNNEALEMLGGTAFIGGIFLLLIGLFCLQDLPITRFFARKCTFFNPVDRCLGRCFTQQSRSSTDEPRL